MRIEKLAIVSLIAVALMTMTFTHALEDSKESLMPSYISTAVASPIRPEEDTKRDVNQKPAEVLAFAGVKPGDRVADFWPAPPYSTGLLSLVAGSRGHVYAIIPTKLLEDIPQAKSDLDNPLARYTNVSQIVQPFDKFKVPEQLDVV